MGWLETDKCIQVFQEKKGKLSSNRFGDSCYPEVMATSDGFPRAIVVSFVFFYFLVFGLSTIGNCLVLSICYRAIKRTASSLKWFIANLAIADLTFTFNHIRLHSFLMDLAWRSGHLQATKFSDRSLLHCYNNDSGRY